MKINILALLSLVVSLSFCMNENSKITVRNLKTSISENVSQSLIIKPAFSWLLISDLRNQSQSAYQILVSENQEQLKDSKGILWDSGKTDSDQSVLVAYSGPTLEPAHTYFWKVKVWDQNHQKSEWSEIAVFKTGLLSESDLKNARWIGFNDLPAGQRVVPGIEGYGKSLGDKGSVNSVVPLFRKEFEIDKKIKEATLYISGLGQYEANINGKKVGNGFMTPGWTNYDKTVFYNIYDVSNLLREGKNAIGAIVGNGFYNISRERYHKVITTWGFPTLIAQLRIRFSDGTEQIVVTGPDWKTTPSPITFTSIFGGESYDARMEQTGWDMPDFNENTWQNVVMNTPPSGKLTLENDFPIEVEETFVAKTITKLNDGAFLYDFGQNASGIVGVKVQGKKGQKIRLTPAELITKENQPNQNATGSPYYFTYILKGDGIETWQPRFTYTGFRYVKVEGAAPETEKAIVDSARLLDLKLLHTRNSTPVAGTFSCSNELFNRTFNLINWGIKSNLQSVLTDCPHREKLGWLEQTYLMGSAVHFNFDLYQLYSKQVNDMMEAQLENGLVPDITPEYVVFPDGFRDSPEWGSAAVILPWMIYKWYGDISVMEKAWPMMVRYVAYLESKSDHHILTHGLGDWYDLGPNRPGFAQLTPEGVTATSIYFYDLKILSEMATILKKTDEQKRFSVLATEVKTAFNAKFFNPETDVISTGSQTAMSMPWCVGLVDGQYKDKVMQNLEDSIRAQDKRLTAGDVGFHYLVEALTKSGQSQLLFEMNNRDDVPGYGYQLKKGATALTESWPALEVVSNNHLMLGHLMDWFYGGLGGIGQSETSVAYKEIIIKPEMVGDLAWVKTSYQSPYGEIRSDWEKSGTSVKMNITIPANTTALVYVSVNSGSVIKESGIDISGIKAIKIIGEENGRKILKVGSGEYSFSVE